MARHDYFHRPTSGGDGRGARALLKDGLYTRWPKPNFTLGLHDDAEIATGKIGVTEGYCYANVDSVDVTVRGVGGHGAYPHKTKDPIVLAAEMINAWQTIASRENNPVDPIVVTVGSIHGGTKHNIISDEVKMQLTVRTYKAEVRDRVLAAIERIAKGIAAAAGIPEDRDPIVSVQKDQFTPATYNNPELTKRVSRLEKGVWRRQRRDGIRRWAAKISVNTACRITRFQRLFSRRRGRSGEDGGEQTGGGPAKFAFEQVRARTGADDSHGRDRDGQRRAGADEEVDQHFRALSASRTGQAFPHKKQAGTCHVSGTSPEGLLHPNVFAQVRGHIEVLAFDDCRFAFFKSTACHRFKLQHFLLRRRH